MANVAFAFVEPTVACGQLYCPREPANTFRPIGAEPPSAGVAASGKASINGSGNKAKEDSSVSLWPDGVAFTVWHCDDVVQSAAVMESAGSTRDGPRLHLVCTDLGRPVEEAAEAVAQQVDKILTAFPGDFVQVRKRRSKEKGGVGVGVGR